MTPLEVVFWSSVALLAYGYLAYPAAIALAARLRPRPVRRADVRPAVSLVIVAHDEEDSIARRIQNCLDLDYPPDRREIVIASDGSTDRTEEIARRFEPLGVRTVAFATRRGKPAVLDDVVPECRGEIVVLGDARQTYEREALVALVQNFADPSVGAVSGELHLASAGPAPIGTGIGTYWRYEKAIRDAESRFDSTVGATGAIYAIRREFWEPIPPDTLLDDVLVPLRIVRRGYRVVFERRATAFDRPPADAREEFIRKVRTIAGNFQLLARERWLWSPRQNRLWLQTFSHKVLQRLVAPYLLVVALGTSALLATSGPIYRLALAAQVVVYAVGVAGLLAGRRSRLGRWLSVPSTFCLLNATSVAAAAHFLSGRQPVTWRKLGARDE